jgi:hypothetical protein
MFDTRTWAAGPYRTTVAAGGADQTVIEPQDWMPSLRRQFGTT